MQRRQELKLGLRHKYAYDSMPVIILLNITLAVELIERSEILEA
jgi:hypothetical protein